MIFLTVGTTRFPFNRLLESVDKAILKARLKEKLIVQKGESNYDFKYPKTQVFREIPFNKMIFYLKNARVIVTHGGPATIFLALKSCKNRPLVVPRSSQFGEHVDDHQVFFAKFLKRKGKIEAVFPEKDLPLEIKEYFRLPMESGVERKIVASGGLIKKLIDYTNFLS